MELNFETKLLLSIKHAQEYHKGSTLLILIGTYEYCELGKVLRPNEMFIDKMRYRGIEIIRVPMNYTLTVMPKETYDFLCDSQQRIGYNYLKSKIENENKYTI